MGLDAARRRALDCAAFGSGPAARRGRPAVTAPGGSAGVGPAAPPSALGKRENQPDLPPLDVIP